MSIPNKFSETILLNVLNPIPKLISILILQSSSNQHSLLNCDDAFDQELLISKKPSCYYIHYIAFMKKMNNENIRQISFYLILVVWGIFLFMQLSSFLPALLGAITFYIVMLGFMHRLVNKWKWKKSQAALMLMLISFVVVLLPAVYFVDVLYSKVDFAIHHSNEVLTALKSFVHTIEIKYHIKLISDENLQNAGIKIAQTIPQILGATFNSLAMVVILYFILYFMLVNFSAMEDWLRENVPLKNENVSLIGKELKVLVLSNAFGIPITAILQGIIGVLGYWMLGVNDLSFWFVVTCITAMVPMVGSSLAIIPIALLFFANGDNVRGILMLGYGFGIMYVLDSVFRIGIQKRMGNVHPLITTFGVITGIQLFGFIGLIFGPILISLFILSVKIYLNEFGKES